jgi:hypothetical protein
VAGGTYYQPQLNSFDMAGFMDMFRSWLEQFSTSQNNLFSNLFNNLGTQYTGMFNTMKNYLQGLNESTQKNNNLMNNFYKFNDYNGYNNNYLNNAKDYYKNNLNLNSGGSIQKLSNQNKAVQDIWKDKL